MEISNQITNKWYATVMSKHRLTQQIPTHLSRKTMDLNYSREHQVYKCVLGSTGIDMAFRHMVRASLGSNILKLRCIEDRHVGIVKEI